MKLVSYNIQYGFGLDGRYDLERIVANLAGADIIALQEVTRGFARNGGIDMVAAIEASLPGYYSIYGVGMDLLPLGAGPRDLRFQFGNMVLSRWPIVATRTLLLPRSRTLSKLNLQRAAVEAVIHAPGGAIRVYSLQLDHVSPDERIRQIHYLRDHAINFARDGGSLTGAMEIDLPDPPLPEDFVLMGDFNMVPESPEYCALAGLKDAFYGRTPRFDTPTDALDAAGWLKPEAYSWMDPNDRSKRMHLDYCFISCGLSDRLRSAHVDIDAEASDHFPVWIEING
ncbi:endonuclease/exonuclease/phosphatase family protein [Rhizobium leucaenae]|uniref:Endonuclease/exonuclease/phosphatase family metal-dependent hydrolase n=1 Tax=Rhizobium leucaenae TaxID=29450 RepID=A0A7W6ZY48_9HYPH|nr:endonuclease/exonuclease/phosphatase family protein [Rhizobium leucaenae]MBB4570340.1 endonuclease/exonuclease/phosphatase family metal-dependent hydrolase [Rhizobium leucaenae]MBB6301084.1 endonuclease/exonuclease/phosphatase family metal-dependent hydrolase [Rhizobium leucaenae]